MLPFTITEPERRCDDAGKCLQILGSAEIGYGGVVVIQWEVGSLYYNFWSDEHVLELIHKGGLKRLQLIVLLASKKMGTLFSRWVISIDDYNRLLLRG